MRPKTQKPIGSIRTSIKSGTSYTPIPTKQEATNKFIASLEPSSTRSAAVKDFLEVMDRVTTLKKTFVLSDVIRECNHKEIEPVRTRELFDMWRATMERLNKIESLGALLYDDETFLVLG